MSQKTRVAVLYGGRSGEHEISLRSAESVIAAMNPAKFAVERIFIDKNGKWSPRTIVPEPGSNPGIDVVFPVLHGTFGENGTVQGLLDLADLPYVGSGVLGSAASMDKEITKRILHERGIPVAEYVAVANGRWDEDEICAKLGFPMFVKPANLGSSVGISKVKRREDLRAALQEAAQYDRYVIVERGIVGREFECSVMGNADPIAAVPCEILPSREFYDYEDKYLLGTSRTELPAKLAAEQVERIRALAVECYKALRCEGLARVDFLMEESTGLFYVNEPNTMPGFTSISMYPKMWEAAGVSYSQLIEQLIELAFDRHRQRQSLRYSR